MKNLCFVDGSVFLKKIAHVVRPNNGLVDPDPHVTQKLGSHVELFSR